MSVRAKFSVTFLIEYTVFGDTMSVWGVPQNVILIHLMRPRIVYTQVFMTIGQPLLSFHFII